MSPPFPRHSADVDLSAPRQLNFLLDSVTYETWQVTSLGPLCLHASDEDVKVDHS